jgi:hypothetical protein
MVRKNTELKSEWMTATARIVTVSTLTSVALGLVTVVVVVLASEPPESIRHVLTTPSGALNLLSIGALVSLPISVPAGLGGGALAARVAAKETARWSLWRWAGRGAAIGAAFGVGVTAAFVALPQVGTDDFPRLVLLTACTGGPTGGAAGAIVGWYCGRTTRRSGERRE